MTPLLKHSLQALAAAVLVGAALYCSQKPQISGAPGEGVAVSAGEGTAAVTAHPALEIDGPIFGTVYGITIAGDYPGGAEQLRHDAEEVLNRINREISTFAPDSELSRFNSLASTEPFPVSEDTALMVAASFQAGRALSGVMDITVGPLVDLWGFGHVKKPEGYVPSREEIEETRKSTGLGMLHLEYGYGGSYLKKDRPEMRVDLATVGEGFAADALAAMLDGAGVENYMIHVAGAIRSRGISPRGKPWLIAVEQPVNMIGAVNTVINPRGRAVSTAGSYRNYFEKDGRRYSHILDPRTGMPIDHATVSVTVIGDSALFTDAMDTGLMVLGADEALKYANEHSLPIYCLVKEKDGFRARWSRAFAKYMITGGQ